jgi:TonB family protein
MNKCSQVFAILLIAACFLIPPFASAQITVVSGAEHETGVSLYRQGSFRAASNHFKAVVKKDKTDQVAWYYLGLSLTKEGKLKDASKAYETALKLQPNFAAARVGLSYTFLLRDKRAEALKEAREALSLNPAIADAHYIIGAVFLKSGRPDEALAKANEAITFNSELPAAYLLKSLATLGMAIRKTMSGFKPATRSTPPPITPPTPEQLEARRKRRNAQNAILASAAESLEKYISLEPNKATTAVWREQLETLKVFANLPDLDDKTNTEKRIWYGDEVTTRVRVTSKPEPSYSEDARGAGVEGVVVLRAVFGADGKVRHVLILSGLPHGLTERAVEAAHRIKFTPAMVNGRPVSTVIQLEYNFNLY